MQLIEEIAKRQLKSDNPPFRAGDTVRVHCRIKEGEKERIQLFEGIVIKRKGTAGSATFTVRKVSFTIGVERVFPLHSPRIEKIEVMKRGDVRRAKLYYLRELTGRAARIKEKEDMSRGGSVDAGVVAETVAE